MIDLKKILHSLDKKIAEGRKILYGMETKININKFLERIRFLRDLREALTIEDEDENN